MYLLVICREDLPPDPYWNILGLPTPHCWDIDMFFELAPRLGTYYAEQAKRIFWEFYWRRVGRYHHHHPFPRVYLCVSDERYCIPLPLTEKLRRFVTNYAVISGAMYHVGVLKTEHAYPTHVEGVVDV